MKKGVENLDNLFLLRPTLFYPIWTFFLAGMWGGTRFGNRVGEFAHPVSPLWVCVFLSFVMGGVFIVNQIQDAETDRANGKLFLIANRIISVKEAYIEAVLLAGIGIIAGFWIDVRIGLGFFFLLFLAGWLYNYPPAQWKNRPLLGLATNGIGGFVIYCLGWLTGGGEFVPPRAVAYALAGVAVFLNTTLPDREGDKKTGKITFSIRYGVKKTAWTALVFEIATLGFAFGFKDWLLLFPALFVLPFFVLGVLNPTVNRMMRATKFSVLALAAAVCVVFPWYVVPVFVVFYLSKAYYRKRFGFDYPSFKSS